MAKPTVQRVTGQGNNIAFQVNKATDQLADAINTTLPKDGSESMTGNLDMNSYQLLNCDGITVTGTSGNIKTSDQVDAAVLAAEQAQANAEDAQLAAETAESGAQTSETNANIARIAAESAQAKAEEWAENPEDVPVETGKFSSLHWAAKAEESATSIEPSKLLYVDGQGGGNTEGYSQAQIDAKPTGYKNILINGDFRINQRGAISKTATSGAYNFDRWYYNGSTLEQRIEDGNYKPSTSHTLSGDNVTTAQITSPSSGTWVIIVPVTSDNVQLEEGSVATPFEQRPYGLELTLCKRYYERKTVDDPTGLFASGYHATTTQHQWLLRYTEKRVVPTISYVGNFIESLGGSALTGVAAELISKSTSRGFGAFTGGTAGSASFLRANSDITAYIDIDAEL